MSHHHDVHEPTLATKVRTTSPIDAVHTTLATAKVPYPYKKPCSLIFDPARRGEGGVRVALARNRGRHSAIDEDGCGEGVVVISPGRQWPDGRGSGRRLAVDEHHDE